MEARNTYGGNNIASEGELSVLTYMDGIIDDSRHKTNITLSNVSREANSGVEIDSVWEPVA